MKTTNRTIEALAHVCIICLGTEPAEARTVASKALEGRTAAQARELMAQLRAAHAARS